MFLLLDGVKTWHDNRSRVMIVKPRGTMFTTPGFEMLGELAQDGGERIEIDYEI
jgi:hypothetical protein